MPVRRASTLKILSSWRKVKSGRRAVEGHFQHGNMILRSLYYSPRGCSSEVRDFLLRGMRVIRAEGDP